MRTDQFDWYFVIRKRSWIDKYLEAGGNPDKLVVHHLSHDGGTIDPLWGKEFFKRWCDTMRERGVTHLVAPDFSTWIDMPVVCQLHNIYKSMVVTRDYADLGYRIIPVFKAAAMQINHILAEIWPDELPCALADMQHLGKEKQRINYKVYAHSARIWRETKKVKRYLVWSSTESYMKPWHEWMDGHGDWLRSELYVRKILISHINKVAKARLKKKKAAEKEALTSMRQ